MTSPKTPLTILLVEDDKDQKSVWEREIKEFNADPEAQVAFTPLFATTSEEAVKELKSSQINCCIVDLKIPAMAGRVASAAEGNRVLAEILKKVPVPTAVVSGHPADASEIVKSSTIKRFPREVDSYTQALKWVASFRELVESLNEAQAKIRMETARIFHGALWPRWQARGINDLSKALHMLSVVRQIVSHLAETLVVPSDAVPGFVPEEFYFKPALRERLHTGDLLDMDESICVVLTPRCDLANDYPDNLLVAPCSERRTEWDALLNGLKAEGAKRDKALDKLRSYSTQAHAVSTHFLPPCDDRGPWFVEFKKVFSIPCKVDELLKKRFASLSAPFVPNLVHRFSAYLGRLGQPDADIETFATQVSGNRK